MVFLSPVCPRVYPGQLWLSGECGLSACGPPVFWTNRSPCERAVIALWPYDTKKRVFCLTPPCISLRPFVAAPRPPFCWGLAGQNVGGLMIFAGGLNLTDRRTLDFSAFQMRESRVLKSVGVHTVSVFSYLPRSLSPFSSLVSIVCTFPSLRFLVCLLSYSLICVGCAWVCLSDNIWSEPFGACIVVDFVPWSASSQFFLHRSHLVFCRDGSFIFSMCVTLSHTPLLCNLQVLPPRG